MGKTPSTSDKQQLTPVFLLSTSPLAAPVTREEKLSITLSRIRCQNGSFAKEERRNVVVFKHQFCQLLSLCSGIPLERREKEMQITYCLKTKMLIYLKIHFSTVLTKM